MRSKQHAAAARTHQQLGLTWLVMHVLPTQLIKAMEIARGNGTSMISLVMPPKDQVRLFLQLQHREC